MYINLCLVTDSYTDICDVYLNAYYDDKFRNYNVMSILDSIPCHLFASHMLQHLHAHDIAHMLLASKHMNDFTKRAIDINNSITDSLDICLVISHVNDQQIIGIMVEYEIPIQRKPSLHLNIIHDLCNPLEFMILTSNDVLNMKVSRELVTMTFSNKIHFAPTIMLRWVYLKLQDEKCKGSILLPKVTTLQAYEHIESICDSNKWTYMQLMDMFNTSTRYRLKLILRGICINNVPIQFPGFMLVTKFINEELNADISKYIKTNIQTLINQSIQVHQEFPCLWINYLSTQSDIEAIYSIKDENIIFLITLNKNIYNCKIAINANGKIILLPSCNQPELSKVVLLPMIILYDVLAYCMYMLRVTSFPYVINQLSTIHCDNISENEYICMKDRAMEILSRHMSICALLSSINFL